MPENSPSNPLTPTAQYDPNLLKGAPPKDFGGRKLEDFALKQATALLNQQAAVIEGGASADKADFALQLAMATSDNLLMGKSPSPTPTQEAEAQQQVIPPPAAPAVVEYQPSAPAATTPPPPARILLTGRSGVGKRWLAAQLSGVLAISLDDEIWSIVRGEFPGAPEASLVNPVNSLRALGNGVISKEYPPSMTRVAVSQWFKENNAQYSRFKFGTPGFWMRVALAKAERAERVVFIGVSTAEEFKAVIAAGFKHYHVWCSQQTFATRKKTSANTGDPLAQYIDGDVTKQLSALRVGPRLPVVWNDPVIAPPSQRIFTVNQWLSELTTAPAQVIREI